MLEFLVQKQNQLDHFQRRKKEIQIKLDRFSSAFLVQRIFEVKGHGNALAGKVLRGKIQVGQMVHFSGEWGKIESIEEFKKGLFEADEGKSVAIKISGIETQIERGSMLHLK